MIVVVMGVSGVGKTTIGSALAARIGCEFLDGDDWHPPENVAKMAAGTEMGRLLVWRAGWLKNQGRRNTRETSLAKWHATESAFRAAHLAIQVHGAYGYSAEYGIERYFRNARAPIIYEGTTQVHKMMQAEHALGYRALNGRGGDVSPITAWAPVLASRG